jgi:energy-coupling factor transporter ATP-binding protein EcfA2
MLTKLIVKNFKRFNEVEVELGNPVVFIGPNNSGKTTALQALSLWEIGLKRWNEKRKGKKSPEKRPGVTINRRDLIAVPVSNANLLWRELHVRDVKKTKGKQQTQNVRIDVIVEGVTQDKQWECGFEFDFANVESFYCKPLRLSEGKKPLRMPVPDEAEKVQMAFLPPMSGLSANETRLDPGAINVRVGEGRTADVLRNLCYAIHEQDPALWEKVKNQINSLFGSELEAPKYIAERGEIVMGYRERGITLDLSSSGRGLQQTLLLLAYMYANPNSVLLLDEPDAHLEILRQRQIYQILTDVAQENSNQIIAASHSEVLLNEAADRDVVVAFIGKKPHRVDDRGSQALKSLRDIGFEHYYQAEQMGWVLYLEGSTDLAILRSFSEKLEYKEAMKVLERPFVHYVSNNPSEVKKHFFGVKEAVSDLKGIALFDRLDQIPDDINAEILIWKRREIENYLCSTDVLIAYAKASGKESSPGPLFTKSMTVDRVKAMNSAITEVTKAMETLGKGDPWSEDIKVSEDFLIPVFKKYFTKLKLYNIMDKKNFHELAKFVPKDKIDPEVKEKLNAIVAVAKSAKSKKSKK